LHPDRRQKKKAIASLVNNNERLGMNLFPAAEQGHPQRQILEALSTRGDKTG
jgi:hypothetical protein